MRPIQVHPLSALIGAAVLAVPFALMSLQGSSATPYPHQALPIPVSVQEMPDPRAFVQIREEDGAYTVPAGRIFILTGIGTRVVSGQSSANFNVDGVAEVGAFYDSQGYDNPGFCSVSAAPTGFSVSAGRVISLSGSTGNEARAWGYLADA